MDNLLTFIIVNVLYRLVHVDVTYARYVDVTYARTENFTAVY